MILFVFLLAFTIFGLMLYIKFMLNSKLKVGSWHEKLMTYVWNLNHSDFNNMCPYFWLTLLNVIILPIVWTTNFFVYIYTKTLKPVVEKISVMRKDYCTERSKKYKESIMNRIKKDIEDGIFDKKDTIEYYDTILSYIKNYKLVNYLSEYIDKNRLWNKYEKFYDLVAYSSYNDINSKRDLLIKPLNIKKTTPQKISTIMKYSKFIAKMFGGLLLLSIIYGLYNLYIYSVETWYFIGWDVIGNVTLTMLAVLLIGGVAIVLFFFIVRFLEYVLNHIRCMFKYSNKKYVISGIFGYMWQGIKYPFVMLGRGLRFLKTLIVELKKDNCPAIDWEEDN